MDQKVDTVVIGAGISGLTAAYALHERNIPFVVLEHSRRVGGLIDSPQVKGFRVEKAAASLRLSKRVEQLIKRLDIQDQVVYANEKSKRYILKGDRLSEVTSHPKIIFSTALLSFFGKVRVFLEPFIPKGNDDESVFHFFRRRFGIQVLENFVDPMVSGIYAGDTKRLSMRSTFPKIYEMEQKYGSLIKALIKNRRKMKVTPRFVTFKKGISFLTDSIAKLFLDKIYLGYDTHRIEKNAGGYQIVGKYNGYDFFILTKNIICTIPAHSFKGLFDHVDLHIQRVMDKINYPPLALLHLGYDDFKEVTDMGAFGFLVPGKENKSFLGAVFNSNMFTENTNHPKRLYTLFIGGDKNSSRDIRSLIKKSQQEFEQVMKIRSKPIFREVTFYKNSIPQFYLGHQQIRKHIEDIQRQNKGLLLSGSYISGVSLGECIEKNLCCVPL